MMDRKRSLKNLADVCSTDKAISDTGHGYVRYYAKEFDAIRDMPIKLLEIGVHRARSHFMWSRYFQQGQIYGIDNCETINGQDYVDNRKNNNADRIHLFKLDQGEYEEVRKLAKKYGPFDIIIDDGSHKPEHQIGCFKILLPYTSGYYSIEDMHPYYTQDGHLTIDFFQTVIHRMNRQGSVRYYDMEYLDKQNSYDRIEGVMFHPNMIWVKMYV